MLRNYALVALRHLLRHKTYAIINFSGLSAGLVICMFIVLWVADELKFDRFHNDGEKIHRVFNNYKHADGSVLTGYMTQGPLAEALRNEVPEVESAIRVTRPYTSAFEYNTVTFNESGLFTDKEFFGFFSFDVVEGDSKPLTDISSVAISQRLARKLFRNEPAVGKVIRMDKTHDLKVTAVFVDPPEHSSLKFDYVCDLELLLKDNDWMNEWNSNAMFTYAKLKDDSNLAEANEGLNKVFKDHCASCMNESFFFPFESIYLYSKFTNGVSTGGKIEFVRVFIVAAILVLLMACANFTNLAIAQSTTRAREIGVRKVAGAQRMSLIRQLTGEAVLIAFLSFVFALLVIVLLLPVFNDICGKSIRVMDNVQVFVVLGLIPLIAGVVAGVYPALYLSALKPIRALKGNILAGSVGGLRQTLLVFQFALSAGLIVASFVVHRQITFIRAMDLGFAKENILMFPISDSISSNLSSFKIMARQIPGVDNLGLASGLPYKVTRFSNEVSWPGKEKESDQAIYTMSCDAEFLPTIGTSLVEGRNFTPDTNASEFIVNETAAHLMNLDNPIGTEITMGTARGQIIGVVKDFHNDNVRNPISPMLISYSERVRMMFVRVHEASRAQSIANLEALYQQFNPGEAFEYNFMDDNIDREYKGENTMERLAVIFAAAAIFIASIGLFGIVSFMTERRAKEISIRKVMGAPVSSIVALLSRNVVVLVLLALSVAVPLSWLLMSTWLEDYAYRTVLGWEPFAAAAAICIATSLLTVGSRALKAAFVNPVESLRSE